MPFPCPRCRHLLAYNPYVAGKKVTCPNCRHLCQLPQTTHKGRMSGQKSVPSALPGTVAQSHGSANYSEQLGKDFACPFCQRQIPNSRLNIGPLGNCPYCHEELPEIEACSTSAPTSAARMQRELDELKSLVERSKVAAQRKRARKATEATKKRASNAANVALAARWLHSEVVTKGHLWYVHAIRGIYRQFGFEFIGKNPYNDLPITKCLLDELHRIAGETVVWDADDLTWRKARQD